MLPNRRISTLAMAGLACGLFLGGCSRTPSERASHIKPVAERKFAPNFTLQDANGRPVHLTDYRGKVVLLNFWATWCGPCKIEIPWFVDFERRHKDQGFAVIGISMDEDGWEAIKPFMSGTGINYRVLLGDDSIAQLYGGVNALPTTFVIDREGKIASVHQGLVSKSVYENDLRQLFEASTDSRAAGGSVAAGAD